MIEVDSEVGDTIIVEDMIGIWTLATLEEVIVGEVVVEVASMMVIVTEMEEVEDEMITGGTGVVHHLIDLCHMSGGW